MIDDGIMLWVTMGALALSVGFLAFRAKRRRGYWPFFLGLGAVVPIIFGKFLYDIQWLFYGGLTLLIAASVWNSWPKKNQTQPQTIQLNKEVKQ